MRLLILAALALPSVASAADRLNIKTGLWEVTATTEIAGMPPLPKDLLDKMSPEQRAQLEAQIKQASGGAPRTDTTRECITERDLEKPFESANPDECTQKLVKSTRTMQEIQLTCSGEYKGAGTLRIYTPTADTMTGDLNVSVGEGADSMKITADMKGRWLGADCGEEADDEEEESEAAEDAADEDEA